MKELEKNELMGVDGGKVAYWDTQWSGTQNRASYAFEALCNGIVLIHNGAAAIRNYFGD
ncbi:MAG: hypothetical protein K0M50_02985 [Prolixibacteraceae bacterium]|nr:hypothetical protein [Prolixibacteraceae bacterium]